jgi:UDP-N-acetyl-D-galactosamine dehydrogenase
MGTTFKENVSDIRNSKVADVVNELKSFSLNVDVIDAHASSEELNHEYGYGLATATGKYDAVILAVCHNDYKNISEEYLAEITHPHSLFADLKGIYNGKISKLKYWSL